MVDRAPLYLRRLAAAVLAVVAVVSVSSPAAAHLLKVFALVEGSMIKGTVYFARSAPARGARITALGPDDVVLAETRSGDDGSFVVPAGPPVDHRIVADAGDGHNAAFTIHAEEIAGPVDVPAGPTAAPAQPRADRTGQDPSSETDREWIEAAVEAVVSRHVTPLREQLNAYEDRLSWHDVLGGIGYILGLTGLAAFFLSRRRRES